MGYLLMSYQARASERISDEQWLKLTSLASTYGFSVPRLRLLERREQTDLTNEEAVGLHDALERALSAEEPTSEHISFVEDKTIDRDTVRRVAHVLRQHGGKLLRGTPD
jgi:hypothetical protein